MTEPIELKYVGVCRGGPWDGQEVRAEMPVIRKGLPSEAQYFHENGCWYWEPIGPGDVGSVRHD
jgi:hypothetical protein